MRRRNPWHASYSVRALIAALCVCGFSPRSFSQSQGETREGKIPLLRYVPADAEFFVEIPRLGELNAALQRAGALPWLGFVTGGGKGADTRAGLKEIVAEFLGPKSSIDVVELMSSEVGIVADGWSHLGSAVWLVRIKDGSVLDRWVPKEARLHDLQSRTGVRYIWTRDGMSLCVRGDVVALARRIGGGSLLKSVRALMNGRQGNTLEKSDAFQKLRARLPGRQLAILQISKNDERAAGDGILSFLWPTFERAAVAMYERQGRLVVALSGLLATPQRRAASSPDALERLAQLPRTTLLAAATTMDFAGACGAAASAPQPGTLGRYLALMEGLGSRRSAAAELFKGIGPDVIFVWGQKLGAGGEIPAVAVMLECADARRLRAEVTYMAGSILKMLGAIDPVKRASAPEVTLDMHLGCPIISVRLADYAGESRFPLSRLLAGAEPSWAVSGRWFILALSRDHLKRILDAQHGLIPTLESIREVQKLTRRRETRMTLAVIQAGLASDVLNDWLKFDEGSVWPLLDSLWGGQAETTVTNPLGRLGVVIRTDESVPVAIVDKVVPGSPADGRLRPDDHIVGVDGSLLALQSPAVDLRRKLSQRPGHSGHALRVRRGESVFDVELPVSAMGAGLSRPLLKPADALRELAALGSALQFVTVETRLLDESHVLARLSLQFTDSDQSGR